MLALAGLFVSAFLAATILPFYSEVVLGALYLDGHDPLALWSVATLGNTLGAVVNWALALWFIQYQDRRWFPFKPESIERAQRWYERWGVWTLLLAWAPVGGDPLTFVAGLMRTRLWVFVVLVGFGKGARYGVILALLEPIR